MDRAIIRPRGTPAARLLSRPRRCRGYPDFCLREIYAGFRGQYVKQFTLVNFLGRIIFSGRRCPAADRDAGCRGAAPRLADQFSGDGIMVFFNDPVPCPDPAERAVKMAMAMREAASELIVAWRLRGCELGFGVGIAWGYATLGQIGFADRSGYTAVGTVCNLAARLYAEAKDGQ